MPLTEARRMSASIGSKVVILPEVLADLTGPLGDRLRRGLPESRIIAQLGGSLQEIPDKWGVTKEEMAGIVPECWLEWGLGAEEDAAPTPPEVVILAAHDAVTINSRKTPHKLGKLVDQVADMLRTQLRSTFCRRQHAHRDRTTRWAEGRPKRWRRLATGAFNGQEPPHAFGPTDSLRVIPATEFVGIGRRFIGIEEHVAVRCPCCDATDVDTRHARICPGAGAQVNQHQSLLHAISRTLKRLGVPHQVESEEPFTADRNLWVDIIVRRRGLRNGPNPEYRGKSILCLLYTSPSPRDRQKSRMPSSA